MSRSKQTLCRVLVPNLIDKSYMACGLLNINVFEFSGGTLSNHLKLKNVFLLYN